MRKPSEQKTAQEAPTWLIPFACLMTGGILTGLSTNLAKYAGGIGLTALAFLFWALMGAAIILLIIATVRRERPPLTARYLEYYFIAALVSVAGANLILFSAIPHVGASFVALILSLPPLLTYVGALALNMERFNKQRAFGVACALSGATVLAIHKFSAADASIFWILLALCGPILLAIGNLYRTLRWPAQASPMALAPGMLIAAALLLAIVSLFPPFSLAVPMGKTLPFMVITIQAFIFAGQFLLLFLLQKTGGPVLLSLLGTVGAVVGVPIAIFLQGEPPPNGLLLGASLIGLGVFFVTWGGIKIKKL